MSFKFKFAYKPAKAPTAKINIEKAIISAMETCLFQAKKITATKYFRKAPFKGAPAIPGKLTYRTGELLRSVTHEPISRVGNKYIGRYGSPKIYARTHELGINHPKRPFLEPALREIVPKLIVMIGKKIDDQGTIS